MQTEELVRKKRRADPQGVSPALQDLKPPIRLTDSKGKKVPLSLSGYVLHFGRTYRVQAAAFSDGSPAPEARMMSWPSFVAPEPGAQMVVRHGREHCCLVFKVRRESNFLKIFKWPYEVLAGDLLIECSPGQEANQFRVELICPVVARTPWGLSIILLLVMGAFLGGVIAQAETVLRDLLTRGTWSLSDLETWSSLRSSPRFWLWPLSLAVANPLLALASNIWNLWHRSRQLEERYQKKLL